MPARTNRKNLQKRRKRRLFAAITAEIQASDELEKMRNEEERQRTHQKWHKEVEKSNAAFKKKRKMTDQ
ncbi:uncharacterized protein PITG_08977 [Phytophthora infestans T30-4]|uniref:Uncharacterized protein n=1 Tax=Phytophthora infestans (strain T30-4) TaxID=403677 RepID=D0NDM7_PHYIT|nr:uncharacterized protein PITG_08977 [Phytophthora infestans T30-4]EEY56184.1 hypothetical protein PITG_08977 [Phytophthora infestans T30-4]|eukprot:XP_002903014.1 hypothetical protein PITG_08977 [Phytophthora infestans T30-4]